MQVAVVLRALCTDGVLAWKGVNRLRNCFDRGIFVARWQELRVCIIGKSDEIHFKIIAFG